MNEELLEYLKNIPQDQMAGMMEYLQQNNAGGSTVSTASNTFGKKLGNAGNFAMDNAAPIIQGAKGVTELAFNLFGNSGVNQDKIGNQMGSDIYGRPLYSYQGYQGSIDDIESRAKSEQGKSTLSGAMSGLSAGASIGSIIPGIGTAIGGAFVALGGAIAGAVGGNKREKQLEKEAASRKQKLLDSTINFNNENASFFEESQADSINSYLMSERSRRLA